MPPPGRRPRLNGGCLGRVTWGVSKSLLWLRQSHNWIPVLACPQHLDKQSNWAVSRLGVGSHFTLSCSTPKDNSISRKEHMKRRKGGKKRKNNFFFESTSLFICLYFIKMFIININVKFPTSCLQLPELALGPWLFSRAGAVNEVTAGCLHGAGTDWWPKFKHETRTLTARGMPSTQTTKGHFPKQHRYDLSLQIFFH